MRRMYLFLEKEDDELVLFLFSKKFLTLLLKLTLKAHETRVMVSLLGYFGYRTFRRCSSAKLVFVLEKQDFLSSQVLNYVIAIIFRKVRKVNKNKFI